MKLIFVTLSTFFAVSLANAGSAYNLLLQEGGIDALASMSKASVIFSVGSVQSQVLMDLKNDEKFPNAALCLHVGRLFHSITESAVRYGRHAKNPEEVEKAKQTFISGMSLATVCQPDKMKVVNPNYAKVMGGEDIYSSISQINSLEEFQGELKKIVDLNKWED